MCRRSHIFLFSIQLQTLKHVIQRIVILIYRKWHAGVGPTKDAYTIGDNPQYSLRVPAGRGSVWVLLTRHIISIDDFRDNKEYITLLVYQNSGKRIYYPCEFVDDVSDDCSIEC